MSVRVHVVGAFGATEGDFRAALDRIGEDGCGTRRFRIGSSGRWQWANASVWNVGGSEIDDALRSLSVPALRVTSSDGVLWMLTLKGAGGEQFRGVHHFTEVGSEPEESVEYERDHDADFPEDEIEEVAGINRFVPELQFLWDDEEEARLKKEYAEEAEATVEGLDDYTDYGVTLPDAVVEEMKRRPSRAAHTAFMAHGRQIVDALGEFGFEFDRAAMLKLLTVGPLTSLEDDSDVGNMPRFLRTLGIDGVFEEPEANDEPTDEDRAEEAREAEVVDWSEYAPGKLFEKLDPLLAERALTDISGAPVKPTHAALLHLLADLCAEHPTTFVSIEFPDETCQPDRAWEDLDELEARQSGTAWQFCFETPHLWYGVSDREELEANPLTAALGAAPDGSRIELAFMVEGLIEKCHRYAGTYSNQRLELEKAYPSVRADILNEALDLVDQIFSSQSIAFASEKEEDAVRRNYQRSQGDVPKIRNGKIMPEYGSRDDVVRTLLFERFDGRGPWDIAGARKLVEADWEAFERLVEADDDEDAPSESLEADESAEVSGAANMLQRMSEAVEQFNKAKIVPHSEEVVYEGRTGKFLRGSMADLKHVSQDRLEECDAALASLGFRWLGDFVGDVDQRQEVSRCYSGHPEAIALLGHRKENNLLDWAEVSDGAVLVDFSQGTNEFHTHFEDGTSLVTTSIDAVTSKPEVGIYVRCYEDVPVTRLWQKHLEGISRFKEHRDTAPVDHTRFAEPVRFLAMIDEFFCRFMGGQ